MSVKITGHIRIGAGSLLLNSTRSSATTANRAAHDNDAAGDGQDGHHNLEMARIDAGDFEGKGLKCLFHGCTPVNKRVGYLL